MVIQRNGAPYQEITTPTPTPGQAMTLPVTVTDAGYHTFSVYAVTSEGNGAGASATALFGDMCNIKFEKFCSFGDGWSGGTITVEVNGSTWTTVQFADGSYGEEYVLVPKGETKFYWNEGSYPCEHAVRIYDYADDLIFASPPAGNWLNCPGTGSGMETLSGLFYTFENNCGGTQYNIYRDGAYQATVTGSSYKDFTYVPNVGHTWSVRVLCPDGGESEPVTATEGACEGACPKPLNLQGEYTLYCDMVLTWDPPASKKAPKAASVAPEYIPVTEEEMLAHERAKYEEVANQKIFTEKPNKADYKQDGIERIILSKPTMNAPQNRNTIFSENFESANIPNLPAGWTRTNLNTTYPGWATDDYWWDAGNGKYAWDEWDLGSGARNAWMFSPSIQLTAGVAYSLSYMFIAGYDYGDGDNFEIKLAQQATVAAMNSGTEIYRVTNHYTGWGESGEYAVRQHTFTPTATGTYYLGFHVFTPSLDGYDVVIDDILVTTSGTPPIGNCEDVVIGTGTSQWYDPLPGWYGWNRNIILYEASEIGTAGDITELAFNISSASSNVSSNRTTKIYMMYTSASTLDAQYVWNTMKASATLVYDGDPTYTTTGWKIFELIAPFAYDGTQNLLVMVEGTGCTNSGSCAVQCRYTTKTNSHWYSRTDNSPPNDAALAGTRNSDRPNITFEICEPIIPVKYNVYRGEELLGSTYENTWTDDTNFDPFSPHTWLVTVACDEEGNESAPVTLFKDACACDTDLVTNLEGEYDKDCSILLTWEGLGGGSGVEGSISTPVSGNGSGAVAFDMVAGAQDVTITGFETEFGSTGTPTIYMYYRPGTACGNAVSSAGWTHIGDAQITVTAVNPARFYVALPAPVTIPAGETYGFYFGSSNGSIRYHNGGTTCGVTTVSGSNSDLTIKGGHGIVTSIPFTGSPFSERNFSGVMHYIVGGGGGSFNVYRGGDLITTTTETTYTDSGFDNTVENTWCVKVVCEEGGQSLPVCITMDPCIPCFPVTELTAVYNEDCCALIEWNAPTEKRIKITPPIATADELFIGDMSHLSHTISSARLDGFYTNIVEDPDRAPNNWIKWSAATNYDGIGSTAPPATFSVGARFIPSDLASFDVENGDILTKIRIYINEVASNTFTLKIYQGGTWSSNPGTLVHTQPVTGAVVGFNEITLTTPVTINTSQELWITYEIYQPGSTYPAGCDAGPGLNAKGNIMHWGGSWTTLSTLAPSLNYNWNIEAFVESGGGGSGKYNIYRNGELIAANHPESSYLDCDADIFLGHTWTITQVCQQTEFGESDPVSVSLLACACHPVQNLNVFYFNDCEGAELSWDAPEDPTGGKSIQVFIPEAKERSPEEIQRDAMKEQMENVTPALSMFAESNTGVPVFTIPTDRGDSRSQILWDNTNINVSTSGILSNYWAGNDNWIFSADDFDADGPWIIEKVHSKGFITTALALPTSFAIVIYSNVGNKPGVEIYRNNSIPVTNGEEPEIVLPTPFQLPGAGKYWITIAGHYNASVSTNAEISAYRWNIYYGSTSIGLQKHVYDKMGLISDIPPATWTPTPQVVPAAQSMWFKIEGQVGGELCPPVSNLNATQGSGQSVSLTWTAAPGSPSGYEILCDGNLLATVTTTSYTHPFVSAGSHNYCVRAVYPSSADCIPQSVCQTVVVTEDFGNCEGRIVGTGTSGSYQIPLNSYYSYSYTQQIFDESEIGDPGIITNIAFNYIHASALARQNQTIYLGYTTKTTFSGTTDWVPLSELIPVYTATSVTYNNSSTWFNFELQEPFKYEGGNLVVAFLNNNGTWDNTDLRFRTHAVTGNKTLHYYTDGSPINPASPPTASGMLTVRNNTRFVVCPDYAFNIYRDGVLIKDNWDNTVYQDFTPDMNPFLPHCWEVRAVCNGDGRPESDGVIVCLPPCKDISGWLVFGVVQAADGNNIVGATLDLVESSNAYVEYHTTSITDGRFEFDGVYKTTYTLTVEKAGYQVHTQTVIVEGHTNLGTIILYDIPYPPTGVVATEINDESSLIEWNLPATLPLSVGGIIGYRVWRFLEENQDNPGTWTTLNNNPIAAMEHIDNGWNGLATGIYMYAVRTCYSGGVESIPAYSNPLEKWNNVVYTINITCDNGANPAGAKVFLANKDGEHEYEGLSGNTGISFPTVRQGEYDLTITFAGFEDYTEELTIMENETHDVVLISIKYTVTFNVTKCGTEDPIADATIVFNGETITGYTVEAPAGTHSYTITKDEYATVSGKVTVVDQPITENVCISPVGVGDIEVGDFNLYPSPASFNITVERGAAIPATIELYNAMGMHINQYETTEIKFEINVAALSAGTYFIRVTEGDHIGVKSFVKK
jgi:hypothetical protein